jgi:argininosuccinate lyase
MKNKKKPATSKSLWSERFEEPPSTEAIELGSSIHFDWKLYKHDIQGSLAHVKMLKKIQILTAQEYDEICHGLNQVQKEIESGKLPFTKELEDIHTCIEKRLTEVIGPVGAKIHTARSRNDQVITDTMLWLKDELRGIKKILIQLQEVIIHQAQAHVDTMLPGFTHLQVAQPVRLAHHFLAYFEMFSRDLRRLDFALESMADSPLGAGALAGVNYPTDRKLVARELGFSGVSANSMDTVSNRDWILDFHHFATTLFVHLSRFSEELILWSSQEFSFVRLSDRVTTGSSIMPQKRNPDVAELVRGKMGRVVGNHVSLLVILKALPLTYNRDLQEDKEGLFDSIHTIKISLAAFREMLQSAQFQKEKMEKSLAKGFALATDLADYLVKKGIAFRRTHGMVAKIIRYLDSAGKTLEEAQFNELAAICPEIDMDYIQILDYRKSADAKRSDGSTAMQSVKKQLQRATQKLKTWQKAAF